MDEIQLPARWRCALICCLCACLSARAQSIFTIAGGGNDDGRPAIATAIVPDTIIVSPSGEIFILDRVRLQVRRIDVRGVVRNFAGNGVSGHSGDLGPAVRASLDNPNGLVLDDQALYIGGNGGLRRVDLATGVITSIFGGVSEADGPVGEAGIFGVTSLARIGDALYFTEAFPRIRRIARGTVTTIAGSKQRAGFSGDGGPAEEALLSSPRCLAADELRNLLYFFDAANSRIRRIDLNTSVIDTVITTSTKVTALAVEPGGDLLVARFGGTEVARLNVATATFTTIVFGRGVEVPTPSPALGTPLGEVTSIAVQSAGTVYLADRGARRVRTLDTRMNLVRTIAGNGTLIAGDGDVATAAVLSFPADVHVDGGENVYIADTSNSVIRLVDAKTRRIATLAGTGEQGYSGDGGPATLARLNMPRSVTTAADGSVYISDTGNNRIRRIDTDGVISTVAGNGKFGFAGDGGPALTASFASPMFVVVTDEGDLIVTDYQNSRIRRIDAVTGIISTIAGNGGTGFDADGVPAVQAGLNFPRQAILTHSGDLVIADWKNNRVRRVDRATGRISTIVGDGSNSSKGDGGPASAATTYFPTGLAVSSNDDLFISDSQGIWRIDSPSGTIRRVAAQANENAPLGDGGPARTGAVYGTAGLAYGGSGTLYLASLPFNRVRGISPCSAVTTALLVRPANNSSSEDLSPRLAWASSAAAFTYDVLLDTANPPLRVIAADVAGTSYTPADLEPATTYFWRVVAKGDPFCSPESTAASEVFSFTTGSRCDAPAPFETRVAQRGTSLSIDWSPSARASTYDVYCGPSDAPRLVARGISGTSYIVEAIAPGTAYRVRVVAHAACDESRTRESSATSFTSTGECVSPGDILLATPRADDNDVAATAVLTWTSASNAGSYDLYLGTGPHPRLHTADIVGVSATVRRLSAGTEYSWRVIAKAGCNPALRSSSELRRFTVSRGCVLATPAVASSKRTVAALGSTYSIGWHDAAGLDDAGSYLVERARDQSFASIVDRQETTATSVSFAAVHEGVYFHRVVSISSCDRNKRSSSSAVAEVLVRAQSNVVVFAAEPEGVITKLGDVLEGLKTSFTLENLGFSTVQVLMAPQLLGSVPFFRIVDPFGGDGAFVTLEPRKPKTLEVQFSGPPNNQAGTYEGIIYVTSTGEPLAFTPQAYINLKVGGNVTSAAPKFLLDGVESEVVHFPGAAGDDAARSAVTVGILNSGDQPMELVGEIGPEAWLKLEKDWNGTPIPPRSFRPLRLFTQRTRAVSGSAMPRSTYLTVRNKAGQSARLLIQDTGVAVQAEGRGTLLAPAERSLLIPIVRRTPGSFTSTVHITNTGTDAVPVELIYTPDGVDGVDDKGVRRATLLVPGNDVVSMVDVLAQTFNMSGEQSGSIEVRSAQETIGQLVVRSDVRANGYGYSVPVALRGEGARVDVAHRIAGVVNSGELKTTLVLSETSGREKTTVRISRYDAHGAKKGEETVEVPRHGTRRVDDVDAATVEIAPVEGGGTIVALAIVANRTTGSAAVLASQPQSNVVSLSALGRAITAKGTYVVPSASNGTTLHLHATSSATATVNGEPVTIGAGQTRTYAASGPLRIETDGTVFITAQRAPVLSAASEALTGGGSAKPLYADGLEHSISTAFGRKTGLILTEHSGRSATVTVRIYEAGHRSVPIAEKDFTIAANGQLRMENLFAEMNLETSDDTLEMRRKQRANVAVVVTPKSGEGLISAVTVATDNRTGDERHTVLVPTTLAITAPQTRAATEPGNGRRRAVGR